MDGREFVWDHFKFNADQRIKSINLFIVLVMFANGGVFTAIEKQMSHGLLMILGFSISALAVVFWVIDMRSKDLIDLTIPAMKEVEAEFPASYQLFKLDEERRGRYVRYTTAFQALLLWQFAFGLAVAVWAAI